MALGLLAMVGAAALLPSVSWLKRYRYTIAASGLGLVIVTFILGIDPNGSGARLWLGFGGVYFQPSELLKILLVVFFAAYLDDYRELLSYSGPRFGPFQLPPLPYLAPLLMMLGLSQAILFWQRDLGAAVLFFGIFLSILYVASGRQSYVMLGGALFFVAAYISYLMFSHVRLRVAIWLDPWAQAEGRLSARAGSHGAGRWRSLGVGLGAGFPGIFRRFIPTLSSRLLAKSLVCSERWPSSRCICCSSSGAYGSRSLRRTASVHCLQPG